MFVDISMIATILVSPTFIAAWCSFILLYSAWWMFSLKRRTGSLGGQLSTALGIIQACKDSEDFASRLDHIEEQMGKLADIGPAMQNLFGHFHVATPSKKGRRKIAVESVVEPSEFINEHSIIDRKIDQKLYGAISGHLGKIGILGTFTGLSAGIYLARGALSGSDTAQMQAALTQLLGGAALDFWTSIVGITSSIIFARFEQSAVFRLREKLKALLHALDPLIEISTIEQNIALQRYASESQCTLLSQLVEHIQDSQRGQSRVQTEALQDIVRQFRSALLEQAPKEIAALAAGCESILATIRSGIGNLDESGHSLLNSCLETGTVLEQALNRAASEFKDKLLEATAIIEQTTRSAATEMSVAIMESSLCAADQLKIPTAEIAQVVANLSDKTRRATDDWTDAILTVERVAAMLESKMTTLTPPPGRTVDSGSFVSSRAGAMDEELPPQNYATSSGRNALSIQRSRQA